MVLGPSTRDQSIVNPHRFIILNEKEAMLRILAIGVACLLLTSCHFLENNRSEKDSVLAKVYAITPTLHFDEQTPQEYHKQVLSEIIDSLAKVMDIGQSKVKQYKCYFNVKIDFLYQYYTVYDTSEVLQKFQYIYDNFAPEDCTNELEASFYYELSHFYASVGLFEEAIIYRKKMQTTFPAFDRNLFEYRHLGNYYYNLGRYSEALEAYKSKYEKQKNLPKERRSSMLGHMCNNIGLCYIQLKEKDSAILFFDQAKMYWRAYTKDNPEERAYLSALVDGNKGESYLALGEYHKAIPLLKNKMDIRHNPYALKNEIYPISAALDLVECHLAIEQIDLAKQVLNEVDPLLITEANYLVQKNYFNLQKKTAFKTQNLFLAEYYDEVLDSLSKVNLQEKNIKAQAKAVLRLEIKRKDTLSRIKRQEDLMIRRNILLFSSAIIFLLLGGLVWYISRLRALNKENIFIRQEILRLLERLKKEKENIPLNSRERQIVPLLIDGVTNKEIAERLHISVNTVKYHIKKLYQKLEVSSREEVISKFANVEK